MRKKRPRILAAGLLLIALVTVIWLAARTHEPSYGGHGLSYWLTNLSKGGPYWFDPELSTKYAAMKLDPAAVPYLRAAIRRGDTGWQRAYKNAVLKLPGWLQWRMPRGTQRDSMSVQHAIEMLSHVKPPAPEAVDELKRIVCEDPSENFRQSAVHSLTEIGRRDPAGVEALVKILRDPRADSYLGRTMYVGSGRTATPRIYAMEELGNIRGGNTNASQALLDVLVDAAHPEMQMEVVTLLNERDQRTLPATRALVRLMTNQSVGHQAAMLVSDAIPGTVATAWQEKDLGARLEAIEALGEIAGKYDQLHYLESEYLDMRMAHDTHLLPAAALAQLQHNPDSKVAAAAAKALAALPGNAGTTN